MRKAIIHQLIKHTQCPQYVQNSLSGQRQVLQPTQVHRYQGFRYPHQLFRDNRPFISHGSNSLYFCITLYFVGKKKTSFLLGLKSFPWPLDSFNLGPYSFLYQISEASSFSTGCSSLRGGISSDGWSIYQQVHIFDTAKMHHLLTGLTFGIIPRKPLLPFYTHFFFSTKCFSYTLTPGNHVTIMGRDERKHNKSSH